MISPSANSVLAEFGSGTHQKKRPGGHSGRVAICEAL
jgi:hypothetical protein